MPRSDSRAINVALQGGGAHGAVTWGVLDRLLEDERIAIESISGTSAGAVNAVALGYGLELGGEQGAREKLDEVWRAISNIGALYSPVRRFPWGGAGLGDAAGWRRTYKAAAISLLISSAINGACFSPVKVALCACSLR